MNWDRWTAVAAFGFALTFLAGSAEGLFGSGAAELVAEGNAALSLGLPAEAAAHYDQARKAAPGSAIPLFNLGVALYKQDNLPAALTAFQGIDKPPAELAAAVHYNQGNVLARLGKAAEEANAEAALDHYRQSIAAYKRALSIEPHHSEAAGNIEVVRQWIVALLDKLPASSRASSGQPSPSTGQSGPNRQAAPGDQGGEQDSSKSPAPQPSETPVVPQASGESPDAPGDETAQGILQEERARREAEAQTKGGVFSDENPSW